MTIKNFRHGRLLIEDGSIPVPLQKVVTFSGASFTFTESRTRNIVRDRGQIKEVTVGDQIPVSWSLTAQYEDRTSFRTFVDGVWDNQLDSVLGLVAGVPNVNVPTTYDYEQNSLQILATDPIGPIASKQPIGTPPAADGEFSENLGVSNVERVISVPALDGFNIQPPAGDADVDVTYDAVGRSTLDPASVALGACTGSISFFRLVLLIFDPCDPPDVNDLTIGTVVEKITIDQAWLDEDGFSENEEANEVTFSGQAIVNKVLIEPVP
ncbi:hypothetical protein LCGC14_2738930 [marine sediment metagenome]|uniref:Uncharacterized protein n=1 Tax=marine sediment metagenome TaxID=412755 RepID=A0A0F9BE34_9ZZZZ